MKQNSLPAKSSGPADQTIRHDRPSPSIFEIPNLTSETFVAWISRGARQLFDFHVEMLCEKMEMNSTVAKKDAWRSDFG